MHGAQLVCVYQFKVVLRGISPMIWRRLLLRSDHNIVDLHYAIQIAMGWSDSHLHRFHIHAREFGVAHDGGLLFNDNPTKVQLASLGFRLGERFLYEYDFYDDWEHDVRLEKVLPLSPQRLLPFCIGGQRLAPPEDCGGARLYMEEGDSRWGEWWDTRLRRELALMAETVQRVLNSDGDRSVIPDWEMLLAALERVKAPRAACPDRIDRHVINQRLRQYARGERDWLFCDTIG